MALRTLHYYPTHSEVSDIGTLSRDLILCLSTDTSISDCQCLTPGLTFMTALFESLLPKVICDIYSVLIPTYLHFSWVRKHVLDTDELLIETDATGSWGHVHYHDGDWKASVTTVAVHMGKEGTEVQT